MHAHVGHKENHENTSQDLHKSLKRDPEILSEIITGAGLWVYVYIPETNDITNFNHCHVNVIHLRIIAFCINTLRTVRVI